MIRFDLVGYDFQGHASVSLTPNSPFLNDFLTPALL
jgi:hypothetical protein